MCFIEKSSGVAYRIAFEASPLDRPRTFVCSDTLRRHKREAEARGSPEEGSETMWHGSEAEATEVVMYHSAILRNKRLLMAYT